MNNQNQAPRKSNKNDNRPKSSQKAGSQKRKQKGKTLRNVSTVSRIEAVPVAFSNKRVTGKPVQRHLPNGDVLIEHREFIANVNGSTSFSIIPFPVNPGQNQSFPWLSQIAPNYESYRFELLEFEYQTSCGSTTNGTIMLGVDYDASDPAPTSKTQFASYQGYCREAPWRNLTQLNTKQNMDKRSSFFVRIGILSPNQDIKLYDVGNLFVATEGMTDTSMIGELYVRYKVRLMTPQLQNPAVGSSKSASVSYSTVGPTIAPGSNAPITFTGDASSVTLTAISDYDFLLVSYVSSTATPPVLNTTGSTGALSNVLVAGPLTSPANANRSLLTAQVALKAGQTVVINNTAAALVNALFLGQFNSTVI